MIEYFYSPAPDDEPEWPAEAFLTDEEWELRVLAHLPRDAFPHGKTAWQAFRTACRHLRRSWYDEAEEFWRRQLQSSWEDADGADDASGVLYYLPRVREAARKAGLRKVKIGW